MAPPRVIPNRLPPLGRRRSLIVPVIAFTIAASTLGSVRAATHGMAIGQTQLYAARANLEAHYAAVAGRMGDSETANLVERIDEDIDGYSQDPPSYLSEPDWIARLDALAALDASLVSQVVSGKPEPIAGAHGLVERVFTSTFDGTLQPFALYVPTSVGSDPTLVILLHGNPQTESEVLVTPYFRSLADSTGTIVAAPLARGVAGYAPPADKDVYQVASEVGAAFHIAKNRTYLVGYSNGGFSVFKVGPLHPDVWTAVMCVAGAIVDSEAGMVKSGWHNTRIYVVNGTDDEEIPPSLGLETAQWLSGVGIPTGFYQQPKGTHYLNTLMPALTSAWHDMMTGTISPGAADAAGNSPDRLDLGQSGGMR